MFPMIGKVNGPGGIEGEEGFLVVEERRREKMDLRRRAKEMEIRMINQVSMILFCSANQPKLLGRFLFIRCRVAVLPYELCCEKKSVR